MSRHLLVLLALALLLPACGGSSSSTTTSTPVARFTPDNATPGPATVSILHDASSGAAVTVRVTVTGVPNFFGAALRISYDPDALLFTGWDTSSSFLNTGLVSPTDVYFNEDHLSIGGTVVIVATRLDPSVESPVDVTTTSTLFKIQFIARKPIAAGATEGRLDFSDPKEVCDGTLAPPGGCNPITVTWSGGGVSAK